MINYLYYFFFFVILLISILSECKILKLSFSFRQAGFMTVDIGLHDRTNPESWVQARKISRIVNHGSYSSILMRNDVAVLKLDTSVTYNFYIGPVCVDTLEHPYDGLHAGNYAYATG